MADGRILLIESQSMLSINLGRLCIRRDGLADVFVRPEDISVLCLHHHAITLSSHVLRALSQSGATILVTDERHYPSASLVPVSANGETSRRLRQQFALDASPNRSAIWRLIVMAKLRTQAANLRYFEKKGALRLERLATQVMPGDPKMCEAQGAKHYWRHMYGELFRRIKEGATDVINTRLNFGYSVLRSMILRSLCCSGLHPALGIGHRGVGNPFNLADDFIEPYRYLVDRQVFNCQRESFDGEAKKEVLQFVNQTVTLNNSQFRLPSAIDESVMSFLRFLDNSQSAIVLPEG
jgi:CRISP-associated protein Cas1